MTPLKMNTDDEDQGHRRDQRTFAYRMSGWAMFGLLITVLIIILIEICKS